MAPPLDPSAGGGRVKEDSLVIVLQRFGAVALRTVGGRPLVVYHGRSRVCGNIPEHSVTRRVDICCVAVRSVEV